MDNEKRKFRRFECLLPADVTKVEHLAGLSEKGQIEDFSREGLKLVLSLDFDFVPGSMIEMNFSSPGKETAESVSGEVVWSRNDGNKWQLGLKIREMTAETRSQILDTCYSGWQDKRKAPD